MAAFPAYGGHMGEWWSIEVFHGEFPAGRWREAHSSALIESALSHGAANWSWHEHPWGVVLEVEFAEEGQWSEFRSLPSVRAALDAVPDPVNGLLVYRGRGGSSAAGQPRRPRPVAGADALALPEPEDEAKVSLTSVEPAGLAAAGASATR